MTCWRRAGAWHQFFGQRDVRSHGNGGVHAHGAPFRAWCGYEPARRAADGLEIWHVVPRHFDFYFPGIEVRTLEFTDTTGNFSGGTAGGEENPESTQPPVESTGIYAVVRLSDSSSRLNLRAQPSASSSVVGKLAHGTRVEVLETRGDWARILYAGATGYVMKSYLQLEESVPVPTPTAGVSPGQWATLTLSSTSGRMHVRQGPSTSTPSLTSFRMGPGGSVGRRENGRTSGQTAWWAM